ncbi:toll/interleukin-1 receptor domain-containing protein [[Clostridium] hylemonae]|uniref:toll/interleukin-1 receptor domain-containing protein n=1 Tax=[Clostridium] hylemonae TaxID=89153 RepID=UPI001D0620E0|nr:toll/interleukin-1 receptor domain-containing protein [[Clostridium] hylemonae]MCB7520645.1 toll/interleukin-1 receptor domain-containing protein [[Clostridium] hylemonae]
MAKIFISYSSKNEKLVSCFLEFLQMGMGVNNSDIFCTAYSESFVTGETFIEKIREKLQECEAVISLITEEYLESKFCLTEMGAAWGMNKQFFPLLLVSYADLSDTPLQGMEMRKLYSEDDMSRVYDELYDCGISQTHQTNEFRKRLPVFVRQTENFLKGEYVIEKDSLGYYEATVSSVRQVKENYRCYGIKGHIAEPPDGEEAASDWLFYWRGVFPDLHVGEKVRFKTSKSKVNKFPDLGLARNIYPDDLQVLG